MAYDARAYTIHNELTHGCHEDITSDALREIRSELATAPPLPASENDQALIDDLQFTPPPTWATSVERRSSWPCATTI